MLESAQAKPEGRKKGFICSQLFIAFRCSGGVGARPIRSQYPRVPVRAIRIHYRAEPRPLSFHRCKSHFIPSLTVSFYLFVGETYRYRTRGQLARSHTYARAHTHARECTRTDESASMLVWADTRAKSRDTYFTTCVRERRRIQAGREGGREREMEEKGGREKENNVLQVGFAS